MTIATYRNALDPSRTPQSEPLPGRAMHRNDAGGYVFTLDDWKLLDRFLILGTEGGTYYANERDHTLRATQAVERLATGDRDTGLALVRRIVEVSARGLAIRNTAAIVALAYVCKKAPDVEVRRAAYYALPSVARTGTDLFAWAEMIQSLGGWSRGARHAVAAWYASFPDDRLAYQFVKYRQRNGWTHRDLLRLAHPAPRSLYAWVTGKDTVLSHLPRIIDGFTQAQHAQTPQETARLIETYRLPREGVRPDHLTERVVWEALLQDMPITALVRNLGNLTKVGVIAPLSDGLKRATEILGDKQRIQKSRIHPFAILLALRTYARGRGDRGRGTWTPEAKVIDALNEGFYTAFGNVEPTGKRFLLSIDTSASMSGGYLYGAGEMMPCELAAAMALIVVRTEPSVHVIGFDTQVHRLPISNAQRIDDVMRLTRQYAGGSTDFSMPIMWAWQEKLHVDAFVSYSDMETWAGWQHPSHAIAQYREAFVSDAKMVNAAMTATASRMSDTADPLALECVGLDASLPQAISTFVGKM